MKTWKELSDAERSEYISKLSALTQSVVPADCGFAVVVFPKDGDGEASAASCSPPDLVEYTLRTVAHQLRNNIRGTAGKRYDELTFDERNDFVRDSAEDVDGQLPDGLGSIVFVVNPAKKEVDISTKLNRCHALATMKSMVKQLEKELAAERN